MLKDPHFKSNISPDSIVKISSISDQKEMTGKVKEILSPLDFHPIGIKVILDDGNEGRVIEILEPENSDTSKVFEKLKLPESLILEFKASFLSPQESLEDIMKKYNIQEPKDAEKMIQKIKKSLIHSVIKTIAAFGNTDGGCLVIGIEDRTGKIIGLEKDFQNVINDDDGFLIELKNQMKSYFHGTGIMSTIPVMEIIPYEGKNICHVQVTPSTEPCVIYEEIETKGGAFLMEKYYVRISNSSEEFSPKDFYERHWVNHKIKYLS